MAKLRKAEIIARLAGAGKTPPTGKASFDDMTVAELRAFAAVEHVDLTPPIIVSPPRRNARSGDHRSHKSWVRSFWERRIRPFLGWIWKIIVVALLVLLIFFLALLAWNKAIVPAWDYAADPAWSWIREPHHVKNDDVVVSDPTPTAEAAKPTATTAAVSIAPSPTTQPASSGSLDTGGGGPTESPDGVPNGTTIPAGSAALFRVISAWPTDTTSGKVMVCYTSSTQKAVTVGTQQNGYVLDAWSTPSYHSWSWIARDAQDEVGRIKSGSLGKGKWEVQGPAECS